MSNPLQAVFGRAVEVYIWGRMITRLPWSKGAVNLNVIHIYLTPHPALVRDCIAAAQSKAERGVLHAYRMESGCRLPSRTWARVTCTPSRWPTTPTAAL